MDRDNGKGKEREGVRKWRARHSKLATVAICPQPQGLVSVTGAPGPCVSAFRRSTVTVLGRDIPTCKSHKLPGVPNCVFPAVLAPGSHTETLRDFVPLCSDQQ